MMRRQRARLQNIDTAASATVRTDPTLATFTGRFLLFKDRSTKKYTWFALPVKLAKNGVRNLTPESKDEMRSE